MNFTENELQVMQILWNAKTDLSRKDIIEQSPNRTWKDNSIHVLLNSLMKKGAVKVVGMQPAGKVYANDSFPPKGKGRLCRIVCCFGGPGRPFRRNIR